MSRVFQNIDPPPPSPPGEFVPPAFCAGRGRGHTRCVERGVGGQYFGRRETQLSTLHMYYVSTLWSQASGQIFKRRRELFFLHLG